MPRLFFWSSAIAVVVISVFLVTKPTRDLLATTYIDNSCDKSKIIYPKQDYISCDCEKRFKQEYPVVWSGRVISTFMSGEDFGVERFNKSTKYKQFYVFGQNKYTGESGANVRVVGRLIGMTCAYADTVFGECVGEVVADQVIVLND